MRRIQRRVEAAPCPERAARSPHLPRARRSRVVASLVIATVGLVGLGTASAARLDTVTASLAAGTAAVTSCQAGAPVSAELVSAWSTGTFRTTAVRVSGVATACAGQEYQLSLLGTSGQQLVEVTGQVPSGGAFTTAGFAAVTTSSIARVQVVIHS